MKFLKIVFIIALIVSISGCTENETQISSDSEVKQEIIDITQNINSIEQSLNEIDNTLNQSSNS